MSLEPPTHTEQESCHDTILGIDSIADDKPELTTNSDPVTIPKFHGNSPSQRGFILTKDYSSTSGLPIKVVTPCNAQHPKENVLVIHDVKKFVSNQVVMVQPYQNVSSPMTSLSAPCFLSSGTSLSSKHVRVTTSCTDNSQHQYPFMENSSSNMEPASSTALVGGQINNSAPLNIRLIKNHQPFQKSANTPGLKIITYKDGLPVNIFDNTSSGSRISCPTRVSTSATVSGNSFVLTKNVNANPSTKSVCRLASPIFTKLATNSKPSNLRHVNIIIPKRSSASDLVSPSLYQPGVQSVQTCAPAITESDSDVLPLKIVNAFTLPKPIWNSVSVNETRSSTTSQQHKGFERSQAYEIESMVASYTDKPMKKPGIIPMLSSSSSEEDTFAPDNENATFSAALRADDTPKPVLCVPNIKTILEYNNQDVNSINSASSALEQSLKENDKLYCVDSPTNILQTVKGRYKDYSLPDGQDNEGLDSSLEDSKNFPDLATLFVGKPGIGTLRSSFKEFPDPPTLSVVSSEGSEYGSVKAISNEGLENDIRITSKGRQELDAHEACLIVGRLTGTHRDTLKEATGRSTFKTCHEKDHVIGTQRVGSNGGLQLESLRMTSKECQVLDTQGISSEECTKFGSLGESRGRETQFNTSKSLLSNGSEVEKSSSGSKGVQNLDAPEASTKHVLERKIGGETFMEMRESSTISSKGLPLDFVNSSKDTEARKLSTNGLKLDSMNAQYVNTIKIPKDLSKPVTHYLKGGALKVTVSERSEEDLEMETHDRHSKMNSDNEHKKDMVVINNARSQPVTHYFKGETRYLKVTISENEGVVDEHSKVLNHVSAEVLNALRKKTRLKEDEAMKQQTMIPPSMSTNDENMHENNSLSTSMPLKEENMHDNISLSTSMPLKEENMHDNISLLPSMPINEEIVHGNSSFLPSMLVTEENMDENISLSAKSCKPCRVVLDKLPVKSSYLRTKHWETFLKHRPSKMRKAISRDRSRSTYSQHPSAIGNDANKEIRRLLTGGSIQGKGASGTHAYMFNKNTDGFITSQSSEEIGITRRDDRELAKYTTCGPIKRNDMVFIERGNNTDTQVSCSLTKLTPGGNGMLSGRKDEVAFVIQIKPSKASSFGKSTEPDRTTPSTDTVVNSLGSPQPSIIQGHGVLKNVVGKSDACQNNLQSQNVAKQISNPTPTSNTLVCMKCFILKVNDKSFLAMIPIKDFNKVQNGKIDEKTSSKIVMLGVINSSAKMLSDKGSTVPIFRLDNEIKSDVLARFLATRINGVTQGRAEESITDPMNNATSLYQAIEEPNGTAFDSNSTEHAVQKAERINPGCANFTTTNVLGSSATTSYESNELKRKFIDNHNGAEMTAKKIKHLDDDIDDIIVRCDHGTNTTPPSEDVDSESTVSVCEDDIVHKSGDEW